MRRWTMILIAIAVAALGAAVALRSINPDREWSTGSDAALAAFEEGLAAEKQLYQNEAREHFARALELDPSFAMARFKLVALSSDRQSRGERLKELVERTDLDQLTPRERFLMLHRVALIDRDQERAETLLNDYLADYPDDISALSIRCDRSWFRGEIEVAEKCYARLLSIDPGWVLAQNHLGYLNMAKGDFAAAERFFGAYRSTAPDQANPHDSLGELYMLTGRYEEARREFEAAVAIRPDFCASLAHLSDLALLEGDFERASAYLARAEETVCPPEFITSGRCRIAVWREIAAGNDQAAVAQAGSGECADTSLGYFTPVAVHRSARRSGDTDAADRIEGRFEKITSEYSDNRTAAAMLRHMEAMRLYDQGRTSEAIDLLDKADRNLQFSGDGVGLLKLYNRLVLASVLESTGAAAPAATIRREIAAVNPSFAERFGALAQLREAPTAQTRLSAR